MKIHDTRSVRPKVRHVILYDIREQYGILRIRTRRKEVLKREVYGNRFIEK